MSVRHIRFIVLSLQDRRADPVFRVTRQTICGSGGQGRKNSFGEEGQMTLIKAMLMRGQRISDRNRHMCTPFVEFTADLYLVCPQKNLRASDTFFKCAAQTAWSWIDKSSRLLQATRTLPPSTPLKNTILMIKCTAHNIAAFSWTSCTSTVILP